MQKHPALFRYKYIPYPCNGGTRVAYLYLFSIPLVSPFRIWHRTGLPLIPDSLERLQYTYSSYLNDFTYSFLYGMFKNSVKDNYRISLSSSLNKHLYTKREYSSYRKDGYSRGATLIRYKCNALCRIKS